MACTVNAHQIVAARLFRDAARVCNEITKHPEIRARLPHLERLSAPADVITDLATELVLTAPVLLPAWTRIRAALHAPLDAGSYKVAEMVEAQALQVGHLRAQIRRLEHDLGNTSGLTLDARQANTGDLSRVLGVVLAELQVRAAALPPEPGS